MRTERNRLKVARLLGLGLAASAMVWMTAGDAFSAAIGGPGIGGGGGPRMSAPSISTVGPRGPNFRTGGDGPKGNPDMGDRRPPRGPKGIVVIPLDQGGPSNTTVLKKASSSGSPIRSVLGGVPPAGETRYEEGHVIIELEGRVTPQAADALARRFNLQRLQSQYLASTNSTVFRWVIPGNSRSVPAVISELGKQGINSSPNY